MSTYAENSNRFDSTSTLEEINFSELATPTNIRRGQMVYNPTNGSLRLNVGSTESPIWRTITNA